MGLDTTHDAWHGAYGAFNRWRSKLAELAGIPLGLMEGFYRGDLPDEAMEWLGPHEGGPQCGSHLGPLVHYWLKDVLTWLPIAWSSLRPDVLRILLDHSDCDGSIAAGDCGPLADRIEELLPGLESLPPDPGHIGDWAAKTRQFVAGLRLAAERGEDLEFY